MKISDNSFFSPLHKVNRNLTILWISIIVLIVLKIHQGDQSFFIKHFGYHFEEGPLLDWYKWLYHHLATFLLFAVIPILLIKTVFRERLKDYGLQLGDWKFGLKATLIAFIILPLPAYLTSQNPNHLEFYPLTKLATASTGLFALWGLTYLPHYIGWEFFFRGYIGFGLKKHHGAFQAIMVQTLITTLMHTGKPEGETWGTVFIGIYLGLLTYRTGSVLWAVVFHLYAGLLNSYFCGIV